jgi:hypothetical protein
MSDEIIKSSSNLNTEPEECARPFRDIGGGLSIVLGCFSWVIPILVGAGAALRDSSQLAYVIQGAKSSLLTSQFSLFLAAGAATLGVLGLAIYRLNARFLAGLSIASIYLIFRFF